MCRFDSCSGHFGRSLDRLLYANKCGTFFFNNVTEPQKFIQLAQAKLDQYHYTGFRGSFITFGIRYVRVGDNVDILDRILPERNGRYMVKTVEYSGGETGLRQKITLDFLITRLDAQGKSVS